MARIIIPKGLGECEIITARAGNYAVSNQKKGRNRFLIPCRDLAQARELLRRLKEKDHEGEIWI